MRVRERIENGNWTDKCGFSDLEMENELVSSVGILGR